MNQKPFHIAIDGPVAAGSSTTSRLVAEKLGFLYVDTGAMYRAAAYLAKQNNVDVMDEEKVVALIRNAKIEMRNPLENEKDGRLITVLVDGEDVSWKIRTEEMSQGASKTSTLPGVRRVLVEKQQEIAKDQDVIMEGRDITFRVLPEADLKIFMTADLAERAKRLHLKAQIKGEDISLEEITEQTRIRDERDSGRETDPLHIVPGAWVIDTTLLSIDEVVEQIVDKVHSMRS